MWIGFANKVRRVYRTTSLIQIALDLINLIFGVGAVVIPVYWASQETRGHDAVWIYSYIGAVVYTYAHRYFLAGKFIPGSLAQEAKLRPPRLAKAISRLSLTAYFKNHDPIELSHVERGCLEDVKSEVQAKLGEGAYVGVNLLIPSLDSNDQIVCVNRTGTHRDFPKSYPKDALRAWECMRDVTVIYQREIAGKEYKSFLCLPLSVRSGPESVSLGAVTIDSAERGAFDGLDLYFEAQLSPYLRVLELALVYRSQIPPMSANAPKNRKASSKRRT